MSKAQQKQPYIQFYPGDWKKDVGVQALDFHDRAVWFEMLLLMHDSEERGFLILNGKPMGETVLARLLGLDKQILSKTLANLREHGVYSVRDDGAIFSRSMVRRAQISQARSEAGKSGGNPNLLNQTPKQTPKQNPEDVIEDEDEIEDLKNKGLRQIPGCEFVWFDEIQENTWRGKLGNEKFDRACEKLNGWIGQKLNTGEFLERRDIGRNATFAFQNWVSALIQNESKSRAGPSDEHNPSVSKLLKMLEETERGQIRSN